MAPAVQGAEKVAESLTWNLGDLRDRSTRSKR